jgi:primosomal protein N' (replication factor Y)
MERFKRAFGERVAVYHSGLEEGERLHEWLKIKNNGADVVVGTRSSVFAPFDNIGLLIVDEEFDSSYKQESEPRYNGRDVAVYRAKMNNAVVILGSATPSAESYHNAVIGKYEMIKLEKRVHGRPMPDIKVVDMKADWQHGQELFLSDLLMDPMKETLKAGEQSILFMNRRGFSSFIFCKKCGHIEKCDNCDIPLVFHKEGNDMRCHYCDLSVKPSVYCPKCKNKLSFSGTGTQKIEEVITKFFPDKRIKRVDMDTMGGKNEYFEVYRQIKEKEIDILIGTQMIAKGFDFPEVTFVGVVGIDSVLNLPDFRAEERVFQLLTQVAGRTGRGDKNGIVAIQTYNPDAVGIKYVKKYEIEKFYQEQLSIRKDMNYPPYTGIIQFICKDEDYDKAEKTGDKLRAAIDEQIEINKISGIEVLGPCDAPLSRIRNKYRISILIKGKSRNDLNFIAREARKKVKGADVTIIVDPASTL